MEGGVENSVESAVELGDGFRCGGIGVGIKGEEKEVEKVLGV